MEREKLPGFSLFPFREAPPSCLFAPLLVAENSWHETKKKAVAVFVNNDHRSTILPSPLCRDHLQHKQTNTQIRDPPYSIDKILDSKKYCTYTVPCWDDRGASPKITTAISKDGNDESEPPANTTAPEIDTQQLLRNYNEPEDDPEDTSYNQPKLCLPLIRWKVRDVELERSLPLFPVCWPQTTAGAFPVVKAPLDICSDSFETQSTTAEDASQTSVEQNKTIQWRDYNYSAPLHTVHEYRVEPSAYCRVIVLLCLNLGRKKRSQNYEFLHCEFPFYQRLTVADVLRQISHLSSSNNKKFKHLYLPPDDNDNEHPIELIHALPIRDYHLVDGQSILVAMRDGPDTTETLLEQSRLLLQDEILQLELRKARIAGRSLQTLYGSNEWKARRRKHHHHHQKSVRPSAVVSFGTFEEWDPKDEDDAVTSFRFLSFEDTPHG